MLDGTPAGPVTETFLDWAETHNPFIYDVNGQKQSIAVR